MCCHLNIQLILKKEDIVESEIDHEKIAVVFDVLFATTTITSCLAAGAKAVIPVLDAEEARKRYQTVDQQLFCVAGEYNGDLIEGFLTPAPYALSEQVKGRKVILSTTNGTVAIRSVANAKQVYAASLLNTEAVVQQVIQDYEGETIIIVCAGSVNRFNLEDFYGAGYFISTLLKAYENETVELSDSAQAAAIFYDKSVNEAKEMLFASRVGKQLNEVGYEEEVAFSSQKGTVAVVPRLVNGELIG